MATCSNCGFEIDDSPATPSRCPRCGATIEGSVVSRPPLPDRLSAPPAFVGTPADGSESGHTLFGVPAVDDLTAPLDLDDSGLSIGLLDGPADPTGPPAIDPDAFEPSVVDDDALELDVLGTSAVSPAKRGVPPPVPPPPDLDLDLPAPVGFDLPAPKRAPIAPRPAGSGRKPVLPPLPSFDLPADADVDLPTPVELNLPQPVDFDLPRSATGDSLEPSRLDVEPAQILPRPADLEVEPREGDLLTTAENRLAPAGVDVVAPKASGAHKAGAGAVVPHVEQEPVDYRRSPSTKQLPRQPVSRGFVYVGATLVLLGAIGAGLFYGGVFDPPPTAPRGLGGVSQDAPDTPATEVTERSDAILALFASDVPQSYHDAMAAADQAGDRVGKAEAALLLHFRYGPDPVVAAEAASLLAPFAERTEPFVRRVVGLAALVRGDHTKAATALVGDDAARFRLYRGWLFLERDDPDRALIEAQAIRATHPQDMAALHLELQATASKEGTAALPALTEHADAHPEHPRLQELLARTAIQAGHLVQAGEVIDRLKMIKGADTPYRARVVTLRGDLHAAAGDYGQAIEHYDQALELVEHEEAALVAKVRALVASNELTEAVVTAHAAVEAHPGSLDTHLVQVEVDVASGKGEQALEKLAKLAHDAPNSPQVPYLEGQVHAMRMQLDEAGDAFARALERDGKFYQALLAEAQMFSASRQVAPALAKIDAARKLITEAGDAPEGVAEVEVARARLLASQQQIKAALTALDQALEAYSSHNDAQVLRGTLRLQRGDTEGGKADLMEVFERTGGYPGLASPLGRLLAQDNELEQLEALVGKRAEHPGASVDVKLIAARLRLAKGELDPAKRLIDQALAKEPNHWEGHMLMARAFLDGGDWGEALERVVLARPTAPRAELHLLRGKIFEYNGKYDEARPEYQQAVTLEPNLHEARFLYGRSLGFGGANKQAVEQIQHAIDHAEDRFPEAYLELGRAQKQLGDTAAALASLERAVTLDSALSEAYYLQGRIRYENNEIGAAVTALEEAVAESSQSPSWYPDAYIFLGRAQEKAGNTVKARAAYKKFLGVASPEHPSRAQVEADLQRLR